MAAEILTIGHSTHPIDRLLALLAAHDVDAVADVRSQPYSRRHPQFAREALADSLAAADIGYVFLGRELGGRPGDRALYGADGRPDYGRIAASGPFRAGLDRLARGAGKGLRIALMCAEKDPTACHRTWLVAPALAARGHAVRHILADGACVAHDALADRPRAADAGGTRDLFGG